MRPMQIGLCVRKRACVGLRSHSLARARTLTTIVHVQHTLVTGENKKMSTRMRPTLSSRSRVRNWLMALKLLGRVAIEFVGALPFGAMVRKPAKMVWDRYEVSTGTKKNGVVLKSDCTMYRPQRH